jgi:hypothetical protein
VIELVVCLAAALVLALGAVVVLALVLPRRVARMVLAEHAKGDTRALAAAAALHAASTAEVAAIVQPLRALLDEQTRQTAAARERAVASTSAEVERITAALRALAEWLAAYCNARYEQIVAETRALPETERKPDRAPVSRERPSPRRPALQPPRRPTGSSPTLLSAQPDDASSGGGSAA